MNLRQTMIDAASKPAQPRPEPREQAPPDIVRQVKLSGSSVADALTPARLITLLRSADQGSLTDQLDLFQAMEDRDPKLDGFMRQRKLGLLACGWELIGPERHGTESLSTGDAALQRSIDLCQEVLDSIPALNDRLFDLLDALGKGFAAVEIIWETSASQWRPINLAYRPQTWFCLSEAGDEIRLRTQAEQVYGETLNPLNWILHRHRARSGFDPRTGIYRSCARPFVIRNYGWKDWLAFAEVFGMPVRVGRVRQGATEDEKNLMWRALQAIGTDAAALIPEGNAIEFEAAGRYASNSDVFGKLIQQAEDDYVIAILGQRLSTGGEEGGSYALGQVHQNVRYDLIDSDAQRLAATLRQQLLAPIVRLNLGDDAPVPDWHWQIEMPEDLTALSQTVETLGRAGLRIPARWVRDRFGIPAPDGDEEVLSAATPPPQAIGSMPAKAAAPEVAGSAPFGRAPSAAAAGRSSRPSSATHSSWPGPSRRISPTSVSYSRSSSRPGSEHGPTQRET